MPSTRPRSQPFLRNIQAWNDLEIFLVAAVSSILAIRLYLELTGYPKLGGGGLHIAHMLWGGLLMLASIVVLLGFLNKAAHQLAAVLGGLGFGTFIDELGKFITEDNDYFYQPAVALIYVTFVLLYLALHVIRTRAEYTETEYLVNALREMEEVALHDLDEEDERRAQLYLEKSDSSHPLVPALKRLLSGAELAPAPAPGWYARAKGALRAFYYRLSHQPWFAQALIAFFLAQLAVRLAYVFVMVFLLGLGWDGVGEVYGLQDIAKRFEVLSFVDWAQLLSSLLSGIFILAGAVRLRRSRLAGLEMFERSLLVSIFLTQVFSFYKEQFAALTALGANVLVLTGVRFAIERERVQARLLAGK